MRTGWAVLTGAALIAASILFIERWEIAGVGYGYREGEGSSSAEIVYRLDRWTGLIADCTLQQNGLPYSRSSPRQGDAPYISCEPPIHLK